MKLVKGYKVYHAHLLKIHHHQPNHQVRYYLSSRSLSEVDASTSAKAGARSGSESETSNNTNFLMIQRQTFA